MDDCLTNSLLKKRCSDDPPTDQNKSKLQKTACTHQGQSDCKLNERSVSTQSVTIFVVQAGIGKSRSDLFKKQVKTLGAACCEVFDLGRVTHVVVDEKMNLDRLQRILKLDSPAVLSRLKVVKSLWLSACIKTKHFVDSKDFELLSSDNEPGRSSDIDVSKMSDGKIQPQSSSDVNIGASIHIMNGSDKTGDAETGQKLPFSEQQSKLANSKSNLVSPKKQPFRNIVRDESDESDYVPSGEDEYFDDLGTCDDAQSLPAYPNKGLPKGNWICAQSSRFPEQKTNYNRHITEKLEEMANTYQSMNERWRVLGYQKAIMALKRHPKQITSFEEAKSLTGVGERLAEKIWEVAESGELRKLNELTSQEENQAIALFTNIWGAGVQTARAWVMQGFRTLDDLRERAVLTKNQLIGLKYYDELMERMSREEAMQIEATVRNEALSIQPGLIAIACGSYRRGKPTCGDVDVLITHPDGRSHAGVYHRLLHNLHSTGFLTDDLVSFETDGPHKKYLGVCRLPGQDSKHRRLDIIVVPYGEYACALVYFTGSAHFNRSLRLLAGRMNMSLNEHTLSAGVVRSKGMKINNGTPVHTPTEESIFEHLGIPYRPPEERDH